MDTVYVITHPSGFWELSNLWTLLSAIGTIVAVWFAVKALRRFEYQTVKPRQIEEVLKLLEFVNVQKIHLKSVEENDQPCYYYYYNQRIIEGNVENQNSQDITNECKKMKFAYKGYFVNRFQNYIDNFYIPIQISSQLKKLTVNPKVEKLITNTENYLLIIEQPIGVNLDEIFWEVNHPTFRSYESLSAEVKELYRLIEEWLYEQGISNLNLNYYKPSKFKEILNKLF